MPRRGVRASCAGVFCLFLAVFDPPHDVPCFVADTDLAVGAIRQQHVPGLLRCEKIPAMEIDGAFERLGQDLELGLPR